MKKRKFKTMLEFEGTLNYYLSNNIPLVLMDDFYELNLRQRGFMMNRVYDYSSKENSIGELVNSEEVIGVSDSYLLLSHDIAEETPVSYEEQVALFKEKEEISEKLKAIEQQVTINELPFIKDINQKLDSLNKDDLKLAIKIHDKMADKLDLDDELNEKTQVVDDDEVKDDIKEEFKLDDDRLNYFIEFYAQYSTLVSSKEEFIRKMAANNIDEYQLLKEKYNRVLDTITKKNVKLANWIVRKYFKYIPAEMEEMQAYALEGLATAINSYNYKLGYHFSTFATIVIRHKIQRHFKLLTGITWSQYMLACSYNEALNTYQEVMETDGYVTIDDLYNSNLFGLSKLEIAKGEYFSKFLTLPFSNVLKDDPLDLRNRKNDMLTTMEDYEAEDNYEDYANAKLGLVNDFEDDLNLADLNILRENINEVLSTLTEREEKVLRLRFGLDDGKERTLEQVAAEFFVTRERVRQIEAKALRKLRHPSRANRINIYRTDNKSYSKDESFPDWVRELKNGSVEKILSMMLIDFIDDREFSKKDYELAYRYSIAYYSDSNSVYHSNANEKGVAYYLKLFRYVTKEIDEYESYSNIYILKREVERRTKIELPVNFYLSYMHEIAKVSSKRL